MYHPEEHSSTTIVAQDGFAQKVGLCAHVHARYAQKAGAAFQAISLTIGSAFASAFGLLSYLRSKADLKLKQLQMREMEIKLEHMEREPDKFSLCVDY